MRIARRYSELASDEPTRHKLWSLIAGERDRTRLVLIELMGGSELLSSTPWLQSSIEVRNPYIDPLNLIQIELLRRKRNGQMESTPESESLRDLLRLTVQGIAAGMRTTG
jgi:phosphoenolpyruvate carboxylase